MSPLKSSSVSWLVVIILYAALAIWACIQGFRFFGMDASQLTGDRKKAILIAVVIIGIKMCLNVLREKDFKLHEQGYEVSLMTLAVALPGAAALSMQSADTASSGRDMWTWVASTGLAFFAVVLSAAIAKFAEGAHAAGQRGITTAWSLANVFLGIGSFLGYILLVALKAK